MRDEFNFKRRDFLANCVTAGASALSASLVRCASADEPRKQAVDAPVVDCNFPGGNIVVQRIEGDDVYLHQDQRDTPVAWFYWYFRVRGAAGRTLSFHFTKGNVIGVHGPALSTDSGKTWTWLGEKSVKNRLFRYTFAKDAKDVRFSMGMPYTLGNWRAFLARYKGNPFIEENDLAVTRKGRKNKYYRVGRLDGKPEHRVVLACRHHSCEMMASYTIDGILESVLAETAEGEWFREHVEFMVVPFVDLDGVEDGDQGKNRKLHDHGQDYHGESIYPSIRAIKRVVPRWSEGRLRFALDLHCPYIRSKYSEMLLFPTRFRGKENWDRLMVFLRILEDLQAGPLVFSLQDNLSFTSWSGSTRDTGNAPPSTCSRWMRTVPGVRFAAPFEVPYANASGKVVTAQTARAVGHDLARAIRAYLDQYGDSSKAGDRAR